MYNAIAILDISMEIRFNMCAFIMNFRHDHALPGWQEIESDSFKNDVREVSSKKDVDSVAIFGSETLHACSWRLPQKNGAKPGKYHAVTKNLRWTGIRLFLAKNSY